MLGMELPPVKLVVAAVEGELTGFTDSIFDMPHAKAAKELLQFQVKKQISWRDMQTVQTF